MNQDNLKRWLEHSKQSAQLVEKLTDAVLLLKSKRITLEEQAIADYFHLLSSAYGRLLLNIHTWLRSRDNQPPEELLGKIQDINSQILSMADEFLKIARYDLNFLEQYFEHDFHSRLLENHQFIEKLESINQTLESSAGQS